MQLYMYIVIITCTQLRKTQQATQGKLDLNINI